MASLVALQAPCGAICSGILSAVNKQYRNSFFNQGVGQIRVATMGHFSVAISKYLPFVPCNDKNCLSVSEKAKISQRFFYIRHICLEIPERRSQLLDAHAVIQKSFRYHQLNEIDE